MEIGGAPYPREEVDGEYAYRSEVELRVDEDLAGQYVQRDEQEMPGLDAYYEESRDITVSPGEGAKYRIEVASPGYGGYDPGFPAPGRDLDCVLEASELRCTRAELPSFESRWRKE